MTVTQKISEFFKIPGNKLEAKLVYGFLYAPLWCIAYTERPLILRSLSLKGVRRRLEDLTIRIFSPDSRLICNNFHEHTAYLGDTWFETQLFNVLDVL